MCVFFVLSMLLLNEALSKPFEPERTEEGFAEENLEPNRGIQNDTTVVRSKRGVRTLGDICGFSGHHLSSSASSNSCVKGWFSCYGYKEAACNALSWQCLSSIRYGHGYPKCTPVYDFVTINHLNGQTEKVKRTKTCHCAK